MCLCFSHYIKAKTSPVSNNPLLNPYPNPKVKAMTSRNPSVHKKIKVKAIKSIGLEKNTTSFTTTTVSPPLTSHSATISTKNPALNSSSKTQFYPIASHSNSIPKIKIKHPIPNQFIFNKNAENHNTASFSTKLLSIVNITSSVKAT